jgi:hypothetical protein
VTNADLDRALAEARILRTHALRATWHFVLPQDLRWLMMLIGPRLRERMVPHFSQAGLTDAAVARSQAVLREVLSGGKQLMRKEIAAAFARGRVATDGLKFRLLLLRAEVDLVVCSGALRGKQQTFALVDDLVPPAPPIAEDEALAKLTERYFCSHGPATLKDFLWWSGLTAAQARRGVELLEAKGMRRLEAGGRTYWMGEAPARRAVSGTPVHLLQAFDEYFIGYTESRNVLAVAGLPEAPQGGPFRSNLLTRDGQVLGYWRAVAGPERVLVDVHLERALDAATRSALENELERYGQFLQLPVQLVEKPRAGQKRRAAKRPA